MLTPDLIAHFFDSSLYPKRLYVGFSGGADSVALLHLIIQWGKPHNIDIHAIHCDHQMRSNSVDDAQFCQSFALLHEIYFHCQNLDVLSHKQRNESAESAARRLRFQAFQEIIEEYGEGPLFLAHHFDDRIETLMIRFMRGSNLSGLIAPKRIQKMDKIQIFRPLLDNNKTEILEYIQTAQLNYCTDASNQQPCCTRNILRLEILPSLFSKFPQGKEGMANSIRLLEQESAFLDQMASQNYQQCVTAEKLDVKKLLLLSPVIGFRVLRLWLNTFDSALIPTFTFWERIQNLTTLFLSGEKKEIPLNSEVSVFFQNGLLSFNLPFSNNQTLPLLQWNWKTQAKIHFSGFTFVAELIQNNHLQFDSELLKQHQLAFFSDQLPTTLLLRNPHPGDHMIPFAKHHPQKLKKLALNQHLNSQIRQKMPLLCTLDDDILWAIKIARSNLFLIHSTNVSIVQMKVFPDSRETFSL